jgi:hypothetical protein
MLERNFREEESKGGTRAAVKDWFLMAREVVQKERKNNILALRFLQQPL